MPTPTIPGEHRTKNTGAGSYRGTYVALFGETPPASVHRGESDANIFSPGRGFMEKFNLTLQIQVGCPGACRFCYVPAGFRMTPPAVRGEQGRQWGFVVRDKTKAVQEFEQRLSEGELADRTIYWSGITDPYAAPPRVTRAIWQALSDAPLHLRPRRLAVQTRFRPDRDLELIARYSRESRPRDDGPAVVVSYSIGTDRNDLIRAWERATPPFEQRCHAVRNLCEAGVFVVVTLSPFAKWHDLQGALRQFREWGVAYFTVLWFKHKGTTTTPKLFLAHLREVHPELLDPDWQAARLREMREVCGSDLVIPGKEGFDTLAQPQLVVPDHQPTGVNR